MARDYYEELRSSSPQVSSVAPVCSNCGASDFVWVSNLKTGTIGRGGLSLRAGGELSLGTRVCRGCGHADLFLKDPTILRQPHTWRPGEFVPIPPRPAPVGPRPDGSGPSAAPPEQSDAPSPSSERSAGLPGPVSPSASTSPTLSPDVSPLAGEAIESAPTANSEAASESLPAGEAPSGTKKPARRRTSRAKTGAPPLTHD